MTEIPAPLRLRARIRRVQEETGSVDPREIADKLLAELTTDELRSVAATVLPEFVRQVVKGGRNNARTLPASSAKVAAVRGWWDRLCAQPVDVSGGQGQWKALRDCTRDELLAVAQHREAIAAQNLDVAKRYRAVAKILPAGATFGSLPADVVAPIFGRAAA